MSLEKDLEIYAKNGFNVLLRGDRGCGKTQRAKDIFNKVFGKQGEDWLYFSCPTLDPWAKLVGIPDVVENADGTKKLVSVQPENILNKNVKAILIDEFNRGLMETTNALMELLDSKSINGNRLPNLKCIWGAVNINHAHKKDAKYHVEEMDPAQVDRFQCIIDVDNTPSVAYFEKKFGNKGRLAVEWWKELPAQGKEQLSARRLDWVMQAIISGIKHVDMLPRDISSDSLFNRIQSEERYKSTLLLLQDQNLPNEAKKKAFTAVFDRDFQAKNIGPLCDALKISFDNDELKNVLSLILSTNTTMNSACKNKINKKIKELRTLTEKSSTNKNVGNNVRRSLYDTVRSTTKIKKVNGSNKIVAKISLNKEDEDLKDIAAHEIFSTIEKKLSPSELKKTLDSDLLLKTPINILAISYVEHAISIINSGWINDPSLGHLLINVNTTWLEKQKTNVKNFGDKAGKLAVAALLGHALLVENAQLGIINEEDLKKLYKATWPRLIYKTLGSIKTQRSVANSSIFVDKDNYEVSLPRKCAKNIDIFAMRSSMRYSNSDRQRTLNIARKL